MVSLLFDYNRMCFGHIVYKKIIYHYIASKVFLNSHSLLQDIYMSLRYVLYYLRFIVAMGCLYSRKKIITVI